MEELNYYLYGDETTPPPSTADEYYERGEVERAYAVEVAILYGQLPDSDSAAQKAEEWRERTLARWESYGEPVEGEIGTPGVFQELAERINLLVTSKNAVTVDVGDLLDELAPLTVTDPEGDYRSLAYIVLAWGLYTQLPAVEVTAARQKLLQEWQEFYSPVTEATSCCEFQPPMLLGVYEPGLLRRSPEWYVSEKYDGWRMVAVPRGFYTRKGNLLQLPEVFVTEYRRLTAGQPLVLDGELWAGYQNFGEIASSITASKQELKFLVFDAPSLPGNYAQRYRKLQELFARNNTQRIILVDQVLLRAQDVGQLEEFYQQVLARGGEGIVLKPTDLEYQYNTRYELFMKRKPFEIAEVLVVEYSNTTRATEKEEDGYVSSLICDASEFEGCEGRTFKVTCKTYNPPALGSMVRIRYSQTTVSGLPKFPVLLSGNKKGSPIERQPGRRTDRKPPPPFQPKGEVKTLGEWKEIGGYPLTNGEVVTVEGSSGSYHVTRARKGNSVYCSCPAWKYQTLHPILRTCKHIKTVIGAQADKERLTIK